MKSRVQILKDQGFDCSEYSQQEKTWLVKCSQCEALVINGVPCHESSCPNKRKGAKDE